jgi:hypothetical protein
VAVGVGAWGACLGSEGGRGPSGLEQGTAIDVLLQKLIDRRRMGDAGEGDAQQLGVEVAQVEVVSSEGDVDVAVIVGIKEEVFLREDEAGLVELGVAEVVAATPNLRVAEACRCGGLGQGHDDARPEHLAPVKSQDRVEIACAGIDRSCHVEENERLGVTVEVGWQFVAVHGFEQTLAADDVVIPAKTVEDGPRRVEVTPQDPAQEPRRDKQHSRVRSLNGLANLVGDSDRSRECSSRLDGSLPAKAFVGNPTSCPGR